MSAATLAWSPIAVAQERTAEPAETPKEGDKVPDLSVLLTTGYHDELVAGAGGRVYLAKDSRLRPDLLGVMYPELDRFAELRHEVEFGPADGVVLGQDAVAAPEQVEGQVLEEDRLAEFGGAHEAAELDAKRAIEEGLVKPETVLDTRPFMVGPLRVNDGDHGRPEMSVAQIIQKSSNVGTVKVTLDMPAEGADRSAVARGQGASDVADRPFALADQNKRADINLVNIHNSRHIEQQSDRFPD